MGPREHKPPNILTGGPYPCNFEPWHLLIKVANVTGFAKRGPIGASNFTTLKKHNLICSNAINFRFCHNIV